MQNAYIIIKTTTKVENAEKFSTFMGLSNDGKGLEDSCFPGRRQLFFTKDQAKTVKAQYIKWWKAQKFNSTIKLEIVSAQKAIKDVCKKALENIENKTEKVNDAQISQILKKYPSYEVKEIPIYKFMPERYNL